MSRQAREEAESGIYHVMLKGINKENLFQNEKEKRYFLQLVKEYKTKCGFELYAYCLMNSHVHLLINEQDGTISDIIKKISGTYAVWYNKKHDRVGHLFQNRFRSKPVKDDKYFFAVLHYILYNPVKAGLCNNIEEYEFSSAREYLFDERGITDVYFAFRLTDKEELQSSLREKPKEEYKTLEGRIPDSKAEQRIRTVLGDVLFEQLQKMKRHQLKDIIPELLQTGASLRQISRVTGVGLNRIRNLTK